ncbi:acetate--CoA ligase family protein [Enterovirga aerilata]|uniref:Acetate--CoA ligase family protein n=1 Tax=Enterovirga aerilata TaxID=2730920 RepID=A0A849IA19_9HYPH|nr:acetate--CoA ligase family protein [Enterovirga sp. DB1703]NNM74151.1 acetate--CoA ligase family protein [Enterovirga sp. DB1703]
MPSAPDPAPASLADHLFRPAAIALVGASDDPAKTAARPLTYLRQAGFGGAVFPVNPARATVLGEKAWARLSDLPRRPDHAFILTPTEAALESLEECGRLGIPVATILADGFAEAGAAGAAREARVLEIAARTGIRIVGPGSLGVVDRRSRMTLTANAAFAESDLPLGTTFAASHSGSLMGALVSRGKAKGIGFSGLVSVGSETDLSMGAICSLTLDDPDVRSYLLFLEGIRHGHDLSAFARGAAERGKPIVAYLLGRSAEARELAVSHTGALAGDTDLAVEFLAAHGIARVETFEGLLEALPLLQRLPSAAPRGRSISVGVVTTTGGGAAMVVEQLALRGVSACVPSRETLRRLNAAGVSAGAARIVDLTLTGTRYEVMKAALDVMLAAPEFDLVVAVVGSSARFQPELAVQPIIDSAGEGKRLVAFIVPEAPEALGRLSERQVPAFRTPESCADAIVAVWNRRFVADRPPVSPPRSGPRNHLDELEAYAVLSRAGLTCAPAIVLEDDAEPKGLTYPAVAKVLAADIPHKTDVGGVVLNLEDEQAVREAARTIRRNVLAHRPGAEPPRILVQPMIKGLGEALVGYRVDPQVGPIVLVAAGGVLAEIARDRSVRLAPVDLSTARAMVAEVRSFDALAGYRGRPRGDLEGLARAIVAMSRLAVLAPEIIECEVNPLIVRAEGDGVVAVDALAVAASLP